MRPAFATFWAGEAITPFEAACCLSFVDRGYDYTVFSYDRILNLPKGVLLRDAREITPEENVGRFIIKGKPNLSHFSDLFRYELFQKTNAVWVDLDMLLLRDFDLPGYEQLLAKEDPVTLCGAIMRLRRSDPKLGTLIDQTKALRDQEIVWGATGPRLLTAVFSRRTIMKEAYSPSYFFPLHYDSSWKAFLPEYADECAALCSQSYTAHLWNDRVMKIGIWKRFGPPVGSFLHNCFSSNKSLKFFDDLYPVEVMRSMVTNWRFRCAGGDIGLGQWMRQAVPSAKLTVRRRLSLPT